MNRFSLADARRLDTSEQREVYVLPLRSGAHVRLSRTAYGLLRAVEDGATFDEVAERTRTGDACASAADVEHAYHEVLERIARCDLEPDRAGAIWLKVRLLPAPMVRRLASIGQLAFHPAVATPLLALIVLGAALCLVYRPIIGGGEMWQGYLLFLCALLAHELGHASACARFGRAPSEVGFLLYLIYPAFYSNVSVAWTLSRLRRVIVDLGGVYFELVFGAGCAIAYALSRWPPLGLTLALIASSCLVSLNPILKFDGYWVVADALGVANLGKQPVILFRHVVGALRKQPREPLPWPRTIVVVLGAYTLLTLAFLVWFVAMIAPALTQVVRAYPSLLAAVARSIAAGALPTGPAVRDLLGASYVLLFGVVMVRRLVRSRR